MGRPIAIGPNPKAVITAAAKVFGKVAVKTRGDRSNRSIDLDCNSNVVHYITLVNRLAESYLTRFRFVFQRNRAGMGIEKFFAT
ncbi:MAG: hypothetical protein JWQ02_3904, partial [Capsulimonas sp.]|nr:hypothetical protein [Capsulimonas sp.]